MLGNFINMLKKNSIIHKRLFTQNFQQHTNEWSSNQNTVVPGHLSLFLCTVTEHAILHIQFNKRILCLYEKVW